MDLHNGGLMSMTTWMTRASFLLVASAAALVSACSGSSGAADTEPPAKTSGPPACKSSGKNAWETYGQKAFLAVNSSIFANVDAEMKANGTKNLGNSFNLVGSGKPPATHDSPADFEAELAAFLVYAYGGPSSITYTDGRSYSGSGIDIVYFHTGLNITTDQYDYFVMSIVVPALTSNGVPMDDVSSCFAPVVTAPAFVADIVGR
jgi:hypothetical protein